MDADDLMRPERLQQQLQLFEQQPGLSLAGSRVALFPDRLLANGYVEYARWQNKLLTHQDLLRQRFVESPLAHPSVMFRKTAILAAGGYRHGAFPEDYELWLRLMERGYRLAKHPQVLLDWRESDNRLSRTSAAYSRQAFDRLRAAYLYRHLLTVLQPEQRPVVVWGAGRRTRLRSQHLLGLGITPACWIDIDPRKIGNRLLGVKVEPVAWLHDNRDCRPFVLNYVTNHGARDLIAAELTGLGYREGEDFLSVG